MRVKCIDDNCSGGEIEAGVVYEVETELDSHYKLKGGSRAWLKYRFEVLTLPCPAPTWPCPDPFACGQPAPVKTTGMKCSGRCGEFNEYGSPNQSNGSFICYNCRNH